MVEPQSLPRRYLTYTLLFYCVAITLYCWFPLLTSARARLLLPNHPFPSQNTTTGTPLNTTTNITSFPSSFPKLIWQTARTNLPALDLTTQSRIGTWVDKNPSHLYTLITAPRGISYVRTHYAHDAALVADFLALQDPMLRADLVQYLFLLRDGGVYTDLDTVCLKPIEDWIPPAYDGKDIGLVLGIEGDALGGDIIPGFSHPVQFATWTMAVRPGHFMIGMIVERVLKQLRALAERQGTDVAGIQAAYMDVMDTTGPGVFAESIYEGLSRIAGERVSSENLTGMTEPRLFGDVLVMPITSFGAGLGHSNAGRVGDESALVQHLFAGSWKGDHPLGGSVPAGVDGGKAVEDWDGEGGEVAGLQELSEEVAGDDEMEAWLPELKEAEMEGEVAGSERLKETDGEELKEFRDSRGRRRRYVR